MVAGAGGIDLVVLVIAADEGVMPQTREHLDICSLLDIKKGIVALTKIDLVDEEWLDLVKDDIEEFLKAHLWRDLLSLPFRRSQAKVFRNFFRS
jgi:selenocysteine-specific translation elongation factor SelB